MIAMDNGPRNGDYVRYIDDLMRQAAITASRSVSPMDQDPLGTTRDRPTGRVDEWIAPPPNRRSTTATATPTTGFVAPTEASRASATAAAIASALMSGEISKRVILTAHQKVGFATIAVGLIFVLAGLLWQPFNLIPLVLGVAMIAWAVRMMRDARTRLLTTRS